MQTLRDRNIEASDLPLYGWEDWATWEGKWELIEGIPYAMSPMPSKKHQRINGKVYRLFSEALESCPDCEAFLPVNFKIGKHNVLHPDLLILCGEDDDELYVTQTPQLVLEILSPSTLKKDLHTKPKIYKSVRVPFYVIIDPQRESVSIFQLKKEAYVLLSEGREIYMELALEPCKIKIDFGKIW
ncbi:MAG: Uma2 family endonuclease [Bacteroidota bacterium]